MLDKFMYPKYEPNKVWCEDPSKPRKDEIPYELEHVFDLKKEDYVKNPNQCCYYSPVSSIDDLNVKSNDVHVVSINDDMIYANHIGKAVLDIIHKGKVSKIKVVVYARNYNKLSKDTLFLKLDNMIPVKTVLKHIHCRHYDNCLFDDNKLDMDADSLWEMNQLKKTIQDYWDIINNYRNGDIIYHENLSDYYDINVNEYLGEDGKNHYDIHVDVKNGFIAHVKSEIKKVKLELRECMRQL